RGNRRTMTTATRRLRHAAPTTFRASLLLLLLSACQERIYTPPPTAGGLDAAGGANGTDDAAAPGSGVDFGFSVADGNGGSTSDVGGGVDVPPVPTGPVCGDGKVGAPETCDDRNSTPGDGCSGVCT